MMNSDSDEYSSSSLPVGLVDQTDEGEMVVVVNEPSRDQGDHQISHEALPNSNDGNCIP